MLRIDQPALASLLEETRTLEKIISTEMENQEQTAKDLNPYWEGLAADAFFNTMKKDMQDGSYASAYSYTKGLRELLDFYLPIMEQLIARCEQLGEQLKRDEYLMPDISYHVERQLTVEYDYISSLNADCAMALDNGAKAKNILQQMIDGASRWVSTSTEDEALTAAWKKLQRLENYRHEFNILAKKASDLEYEMTYEMDKIIAENDKYTAFCISTAELDKARRDKEMCTFDEIEQVKALEYDLETVKDILAREEDTWTDAECEYLAGAFEACLEQNDIMGLNYLIYGMLEKDDETWRTELIKGIAYTTKYYTVQPDHAKIEKITGQIDKVRHATAYQTLSNLAQTEMMRVKLEDNGIQPMFMVWLDKERDGKTSFTMSLTGNGYGVDRDTDSIRVYVQGIEDVLPAEKMKNMDKLGYTYEEIVAMMSQYELNISYKEYEALSEEENGNYDELAKRFLFAVIPEDADLLYEYSVPIGYDMTMTYSASTKGTVPGDVVNTTLEYQKTQLQSISFNQGNTDLSLGEGSVGVGQKVDVGDDVQVGGGFEFGNDGAGISYEIIDGDNLKGLKYEKKINGTSVAIYYIETKIEENASVYSEVEIAKEGNDDSKGWEPVGVTVLDELPEPIRKIIENPVFSIPNMPTVPLPAF